MSIFNTQVFQAGITRMQLVHTDTHTHALTQTQHVVSDTEKKKEKKTEVNTGSYSPPTHVQHDTATVKLFTHSKPEHLKTTSRNDF